jgi:hypothetical protein
MCLIHSTFEICFSIFIACKLHDNILIWNIWV